jgi:hypothetical protein
MVNPAILAIASASRVAHRRFLVSIRVPRGHFADVGPAPDEMSGIASV